MYMTGRLRCTAKQSRRSSVRSAWGDRYAHAAFFFLWGLLSAARTKPAAAQRFAGPALHLAQSLLKIIRYGAKPVISFETHGKMTPSSIELMGDSLVFGSAAKDFRDELPCGGIGGGDDGLG